MMKHVFIFIFFVCSIVRAQEFGMGLILDDSKFDTAPRSASLMRGDYSNLPDSASLKQYTPTPGNQGPYGTCTGWSSAYAARTIIEARNHRWQKGSVIDDNAFSPSFVYNQIRFRKNCSEGASLIDALNLLKEQGDVLLKDFAYDCQRDVSAGDIAAATRYRIIEYREIAGRRDTNKYRFVRKSIAEEKPVVIAFDCPPSFHRARDFWNPDKADYHEWGRGHAMTVIGYDNNKYGGAFEVINSWGTAWGNEGYIWIRYSDFEYFCKLAFEIVGEFPADTLQSDLSGYLSFRESSGRKMRARQDGGYFVMENPYPAGTLFELRISNNQPAYVYAFSSDMTNRVYRIFPSNDRVVPYLAYKQNNIAIPDEDSYCMLDTVRGTTYFCFLYSREALDADSLIGLIEKTEGTFWQRLKTALGEKMVLQENTKLGYSDKIFFEARSRGRSVVPVLVEIKHF
ncbi:MAG: C1 family peptidase [Bacteroidota bacterium]